jgi:hypothetical protein
MFASALLRPYPKRFQTTSAARKIKFMRGLIVAAAVFVALVDQVAVAANVAANLSSIYALAFANDEQYAAAVHAAVAGREKSAQGFALRVPTVGINGNVRLNYDASNAYTGYQSY